MYWSVFLFLPAITWQRHLGGKWMSDVWSVCTSVVASSVHWWVERWWGKGRDNAVVNSVWTSSVCMQGRLPWCPGSQVSGEFPSFLRLLSCQWRLFLLCRAQWGWKHMQKRLSGSCWQMHVARHRSSTHFGFQKWSGLIWATCSHCNETLCGQGFLWPCGDSAPAVINTFYIISCFGGSYYIFALFNGMSDLILSIILILKRDCTI